MVWHGMPTVWYGTERYGMVWYGMVWYGMVWYGMVWYGMVWYGMVMYGMVRDCMGLYSVLVIIQNHGMCGMIYVHGTNTI
jgi:chloride channel 2